MRGVSLITTRPGLLELICDLLGPHADSCEISVDGTIDEDETEQPRTPNQMIATLNSRRIYARVLPSALAEYDEAELQQLRDMLGADQLAHLSIESADVELLDLVVGLVREAVFPAGIVVDPEDGTFEWLQAPLPGSATWSAL
jgi:hypothetical protein